MVSELVRRSDEHRIAVVQVTSRQSAAGISKDGIGGAIAVAEISRRGGEGAAERVRT